MKKYNIFLLSLVITLFVSCINSKNNNEEFVLNNNEKKLLDCYEQNQYKFEKNEKKIDSLRNFLLSQRGKNYLSELDKIIKNEPNMYKRVGYQAYVDAYDDFLFNYKSLKSQIGLKNDNKFYKNTPNGFEEFLKDNYKIEYCKNDYDIKYKKGNIILIFKSKNTSKSFRYNGNTFVQINL